MQCQNNLKVLGLACHNYNDSHGHFPPGTLVESAKDPEARLGLLVELMPYIEANDLYARLDRKHGWQAPANQPVVTTAVKVFRCPSEHRTGPDYANITNYVGLAGAGDDAATLPARHKRAGFFGHERETKVEDVKDGTSNTLLFLETIADNGPWAAGGPATVRGVDPDAEPPIAKGGPFGVVHSDTRWNFGGIKASANAAMGDGSVRRVYGKTSAEVLAALATVAGGEELPADW